MTPAWVSLPERWKLQDIQAALTVIVACLSAVCIFVFARFCWQMTASKVAKGQHARLPALLTLNTVGEALDVLMLLKWRIFSRKYLGILAQCIVVCCLAATAILSGPIARYSSRIGHIVSLRTVPGLLAAINSNSISYANVEWNEIETALDRAGFPYDQLLDYLPDSSVQWVYDPKEWNSTWSMTCNYTDSTPISVYDTGDCSSFLAEVPGLSVVFSENDYYSDWWTGLYVNGTLWKDILLYGVGLNTTNYDYETSQTLGMTISITATHLHHVAKQLNDSSRCQFGQGDIESASYTKVDCDLNRPQHIPDENYRAFPDTYVDASSLPAAYAAYYNARFAHESASDLPITVITPKDLLRFYQVYTISKDVFFAKSVPRALSVNLAIVQVAIAFLVVASAFTFLCLLGILMYGIFSYRKRHVAGLVPESKLDWILQSIQDEEQQQQSDIDPGQSRRRSKPWVQTQQQHHHHQLLKKDQRRRTEFEMAKLGGVGEPGDSQATQLLQPLSTQHSYESQPPYEPQRLYQPQSMYELERARQAINRTGYFDQFPTLAPDARMDFTYNDYRTR